MKTGKWLSEGYQTVVPYLVLRDAAGAIEYYKKVFGATEKMRMPGPDGTSIKHGEIIIQDHVVMLGDEDPKNNCFSPLSMDKPSPVSLMVYVPDIDETLRKAVAAGGKIIMPATDMFWGDRFGKFQDPYGHVWSVATHIKDLTPEEIAKAAAEAFAKNPDCGT